MPSFIALILLIFFLGAGIWFAKFGSQSTSVNQRFDGERAFQDIEVQMSFGPRTPGSDGHQRTIEYILSQTRAAGWDAELHQSIRLGHPIKNVIARRNNGGPQIILAAHYDTRFISDHDPDPAQRGLPVPGANDGASGVGVLLELARSLPEDLPLDLWLVFFDAEDQGNIAGWDWILGSRAFVEERMEQPEAVVVVDMIGDADLNIFYERNSDPALSQKIWQIAAQLGYQNAFIPEYKYTILDDHIPFIERGIKAIVIIDFDYPYWHTRQDTLDKVSAESLEQVGETLHHWLIEYK
ncbi:MAG: M28 family peptidase [Chloroflexota bacterium]